jgi:hypothetical protein
MGRCVFVQGVYQFVQDETGIVGIVIRDGFSRDQGLDYPIVCVLMRLDVVRAE